MRALRNAGAALLALCAALALLALIARGDGLAPHVIAVPGATLAATPAGALLHHVGSAQGIAFLRDGSWVGAGADGRIERIDAAGSVARTFEHPGGVTALALSPDDRLLASAGYDRMVRLWRVADGRPAGRLGGHDGTVWTVAWSADGQWLASAGEDRLIRIWRARDLRLVHVFAGTR